MSSIFFLFLLESGWFINLIRTVAGPLSPTKVPNGDAKELLEAHQTPVIEIPEPMKA